MLAYNLGDCHAFEQSTEECVPSHEKARSAASTIVRLPELLVSHPHLAGG